MTTRKRSDWLWLYLVMMGIPAVLGAFGLTPDGYRGFETFVVWSLFYLAMVTSYIAMAAEEGLENHD